MFIFQKQSFMEIFSGVHRGFKVTKHNKFLKRLIFFEAMVNDGGNQFSNIFNNIPDG